MTPTAKLSALLADQGYVIMNSAYADIVGKVMPASVSPGDLDVGKVAVIAVATEAEWLEQQEKCGMAKMAGPREFYYRVTLE